MGLDRDRVGTTYDTYRYEVSREKIREYARALGEEDPRYHSPGDDCVAPPTFAACFTLGRGAEVVLSDPELGAEGIPLHGSQSYAWGRRPLRPGDVLECTPRIAGIRGRSGTEFLTIEIDCRFVDSGERAVTAETMLVLLEEAGEEGGG